MSQLQSRRKFFQLYRLADEIVHPGLRTSVTASFRALVVKAIT